MLKQAFASLILVTSLSASALTELSNGDILLSKQEMGQLNDQINFLLKQAYIAGLKDGAEEIKSNTKLCPKNL